MHDFTRKEGVEHREIVLPDGLSADRALDRSALWNAAEFAEKRKDARVAREFEIALPHELSPEGRLKAARAFAQDLANRYGAAVDFAIHSPSEHGDIRNHHAHDGRRDDRTEDNKGYRRIRWSDLMSQGGAVPGPTEALGQQSWLEPGKPAPLVPAITRYQRSVEEVAQIRAMSVIEQQFDTVESLVRRVFRDPAEVAARLRTAMTEKEGNGTTMAKAMAEQPERFGELRGKSGLFGYNKERKEALQYARSLSAHIGYVSEAWERRLGEERQSEQWQRDKRDVIEVPGLTPRSAEILAQVKKMPAERRSKFIKELRSSPEGQTALDEAKLVADALTRRFGSSDPRRFAEELETCPLLAKQAEQIRTIARMVDRTRCAELSHDYALKRQLNQSPGLGLSR